MKRSAMKPSTKPMSRGKPMKIKRKIRQKINGIDYLAMCRGQECFIKIAPVCAGIDTIVPAHSNQQKHGKSMGLKASDIYTVPACMACHFLIDQGNKHTKQEKFQAWDRAYEKWSIYRETL